VNAQALGVIPARIGSSRLHRKPLHLLAGRPLIEWVWRRASESDLFDRVVIATDSSEVVQAAERFGGFALLTSPDHPSGTDRVAEVARRPEFADFAAIVNIQGDEPFVRADQLRSALGLVRDSGWEVGTVAAPISSVEEWHNPAVVKVVRADDGGAIFFSRAPIPHRRDGPPVAEDLASGLFLRHIGVYAYQRDALLRWVSLPEGDLEQLERLEQLRPLAAGIKIGVENVAASHEDAGVDTPADAERADLRLRHETSRDNILTL
jgi:3-deoxy-manno-octulosonate cytidylyltransferase (CMP-KDO synthetase)